jgi:hypothetical protein
MLLNRRAIYYADQPLTDASLWRQIPIVKRGQIIRAIVIGLLFSAVFLWALPQYQPSAEGAPNPRATAEAVADAS